MRRRHQVRTLAAAAVTGPLFSILAGCVDLTRPGLGPDTVVAAVAITPSPATVEVGRRLQLTAVPRNAAGEALMGKTVTWTSSNPGVVAISVTGLLTGLAAGEATITAFSGSRTSTATISVTTASTVEVARSADAFVNSIGTNVHLSYLGTVYDLGFAATIKPKLQRLGIRHLRDGGIVVPDDQWMRIVYGRVNEVASLGVKFNLYFAPERFPNGDVGPYNDASHLTTLMRYVNADAVASFEGLNEHDLSGRPNWVGEVRMSQRALYEAIKSNASLARYPVVAPSVTSYEAANAVGNLGAYVDYGNMHPYPGGRTPSSSIMRNIDALSALNGTDGARPIIATETGYHNALGTVPASLQHWGVSEAAGGKYMSRLFFEYFNAGVQRTFSYEFIDGVPADDNVHWGFGLLRHDGTEKPAYEALANLIGLLSDPGPEFVLGRLNYQLSGATADVHQTLLQKRDGRFYLVLWLEVPSYDVDRKIDLIVPTQQVTIALAQTVREARAYLPFQSSTVVQEFTATSRLTVDVPDHALVIELVP